MLAATVALAIYYRNLSKEPPLSEMSDYELQYRLYCRRCMNQNGAEYEAELDRRGAPYVAPWTEPKGLI